MYVMRRGLVSITLLIFLTKSAASFTTKDEFQVSMTSSTEAEGCVMLKIGRTRLSVISRQL